ncbi:hypothetical protein FF2_003129 [Malus domestica]
MSFSSSYGQENSGVTKLVSVGCVILIGTQIIFIIVRLRNFRRGCFLADEHTTPWRLAPVEGCCRASASLSGVVGQDSLGKTLRARLKEKDNVNFERCLCGALGVGLEAHNQG